MTNLALSKQVSLSASACLSRVQKLRDSGFIDQDISIIRVSKIAPALHVFLEITLLNHSLKDHKQFESGIDKVAEITMALKVSGRFDYLLAVTTRDMASLNNLSDDLLGSSLGISKLVTIPILDVAKNFSGFPLSMLHQPDNRI